MHRFFSRDWLYAAIQTRLQNHGEASRNRSFSRRLGISSFYVGNNSHLVGLDHITMGENFYAGEGFWLAALTEYAGEEFSPELVIGDNVTVSFWSHIAAVNYVEIGSGTLIGSKVVIIDHNHGSYGPQNHSSPEVPPAHRSLSRGRVVIGKNVWIGDGVVVAPDSEIGEGSIIGANAVVTRKIPSYTIAVGIPAKPIKQFDFEKKEWVALP